MLCFSTRSRTYSGARISALGKSTKLVSGLMVPGACLFLSAGGWDWPNAWLLLILNLIAGIAAMRVFARNPSLVVERSNVKAGKSWDKPIVAVVVLVGPVSTWITAGLDIRFHWSDSMPWVSCVVGVLAGLLSIALITWAMHTNNFFSAIVRIQKDRGHVVVSSGPYAYVRHPAYTGMALFTLATPLILNSRWAFVPAVITAVVHVLRTVLEDRTLHDELEGYATYAREVRYRLVPMVW